MALRILNRFPGANVRLLSLRQAPDPEVVFTADPHGGTEALWFDFRIEDPDPPATVPEQLTLTLRFFGNLLGGNDPARLRPVMREPGKSWNRLRAPSVTVLDDGQPLLRWTIPYPTTRTEIAFSHPYGRDELEVLLQRAKGYWREESIGLTQGGRVLTRLDNQVGAANGGNAPRGLYLVARQHSGETPGSWVLDGLLEAISRARNAGWCVWAVPFANLDGVVAGDYGKDPFPYDLNRAWGHPPMRHEIRVLQSDMRRWAARCRPELVLDLHAPGACEQEGVYAFANPANPANPEADRALQAWGNVLGKALAPEFAAHPFVRKAEHASRWETPRVSDYVQSAFGCAALSIETPYAVCRDSLMTPKQYREVGRRMAQAILGRWQNTK